MENKKTIEYLNTKAWYRFLKVIYLVFLIFFLISPLIAIFFSYSPEYDNTNSYIKCANGKNFFLRDKGINLYDDFMWEDDKEKAKGLCFDGEVDVEKDSISGHILRAKIISTTENSGKYELISKYTSRNWVATIGFSLLSIAVALLVFELVRRIFYYVVLGKIRPEK